MSTPAPIDIGTSVSGLAAPVMTALGVVITAGLGLAGIKWGVPYGISFLKRIAK